MGLGEEGGKGKQVRRGMPVVEAIEGALKNLRGEKVPKEVAVESKTFVK